METRISALHSSARLRREVAMGTARMTTGPRQRRRSRPRVPARVRHRWPLSQPSARSKGHLNRSEHRSSYSRSYLAHFDAPYIAQGLTFRLADSVPRSAIEPLPGRIGLSEVLRTEEARHQELLRRVARYEDAGRGECHLTACGETHAAFDRRCIPAEPLASLRSSLHFSRNTPGIPPSCALSDGRLASLGAHAGSTTGC